MNVPADVLVIMPHPDDAEFGCAGTVARWVREGRSVVYIVCTNGDKGTEDRSITPARLAELRRVEQNAAAAVLGVREVVYLGFPDQGLEDTPDFRREVVRQIRAFRPTTVVTVDPYRRYIWHRDHRIAGQVVLDAVYPYARDYLAYPDLVAEGFEPHKVAEVYCTASEDVNCREDISATFDLKIQALKCHESQVGPRMKDTAKWLRKRAEDAAQGTGYQLAEAFHRIEIEMVGPVQKKSR